MATTNNRISAGHLRAASAVSLLWFGSLAGAGCAFLVQVLLARRLDAAEFGAFAAALNTVTLIAPLASFGLGALWLRIFGEEGWGGMRWLRGSLRYIVGSTALVLAGLALWAFYGPHDATMRGLLVLLSAFLLSQIAVELVSSRLQLEARYLALALWQFLPHLLRLIALAAFAFLLTRHISLEQAALAYAGVSLIVVAIGAYYLWQMYHAHFSLHGHGPKPETMPAGPAPSLRRIFAEAWPFGAAGVFHLIYFQSNIILLKYIRGDEAAGVYNVAFVVMSAVYLFPSVIYQKFLLPKIHIWANHNQERFVEAYKKGRAFMLLTGIAAMIFVSILSPFIISTLFGQKYEDAHVILSILSIAIPIRFVATSVGSLLVSGRNMANKSYIMGTVALLNLGANILLIPRYGLYGAAISTILCELVLLVLYYTYSRKYVDLRTSA
ncbi:oligosaccharide flippase family protein [Sphingopyxis sp. 550A]